MKHNARFARCVAVVLFVFGMAGCGALPVGMSSTDGSAEGCRPSSYEPYYDSNGRINQKRDRALYDEERIKHCEQFYNEAERQRKEALSQDLEEYMKPRQPESETQTESSIVITQDNTELD